MSGYEYDDNVNKNKDLCDINEQNSLKCRQFLSIVKLVSKTR